MCLEAKYGIANPPRSYKAFVNKSFTEKQLFLTKKWNSWNHGKLIWNREIDTNTAIFCDALWLLWYQQFHRSCCFQQTRELAAP
jgi:hypothetical protein